MGERFDDGDIAVDDMIDDGMQYGARPVDEATWVRFEPAAALGEWRRRTVAHVHDEAVADEHLDLTELGHLFVGEVLGGLHHDEHRSFVHVELRSLVGLDGILDGERMQPVVLAQRANSSSVGS